MSIPDYSPFWMVWRVGGMLPSHRHTTEESARQEAQRLAKLHPGHEFIVLRAVAKVRKDEVQWRELSGHPIPWIGAVDV